MGFKPIPAAAALVLTLLETFAKKSFPQQPKPKQRFSAVFIPNHS